MSTVRTLTDTADHVKLYDATMEVADELARKLALFPTIDAVAAVRVPKGRFATLDELAYELQLIALHLPAGISFVDESNERDRQRANQLARKIHHEGAMVFYLVARKEGH